VLFFSVRSIKQLLLRFSACAVMIFLGACRSESIDSCKGVDTGPKLFSTQGIHPVIVDRTLPADFLEALTPLDLSQRYASENFAVAVVAYTESALAQASPWLRFAFLPKAQACSPAPPTLAADVSAINIYTVNAIGNDFAVGDEVTSLFSIFSTSAYGQFHEELAELESWNTESKPSRVVLDSASHTSAFLVLSEADKVATGTYQFTVVASLENGDIFTSDTLSIDIVAQP